MCECPILNNCELEIKVMEWALTPRQGKKSNGEPNTQLALGLRRKKVKDIIQLLKHHLQVTIKHNAEYDWKRHC